jgi:hypothetical protein
MLKALAFVFGVYLNTNHDKLVDSAVALADSVLQTLGVDCNTWSTDCIDGDDQGLMFMIT